MFTARKMIASGSRWLLAAFILLLCLASPVPCAAASSTNLAARATTPPLAPDNLDGDLPEITAEILERAKLGIGDRVIRRGRPPSPAPKRAIKLRLDPEVLAYYRSKGPGWQTRINETLRRAAKRKAR